MAYWSKAPLEREQMVLFAPTLDATVGEDHPVRLFDEILGGCDWSEWEREYDGGRGQPPIHPRVMAGAILYALSRGVRSSRHLEYLIRNNIDFMWLTEGRTIDHSTICIFRRQFREPIKRLFRELGQVALRVGLIRLNEVGLDGTRVRANNSRYETVTGQELERQLAGLDAQIEQMLAEAEGVDAQEEALFGIGESSTKLPPELCDLKERQQRLKGALAQVRAAEASRRRKKGIDARENPAQVPATDPDSKVLPNKEGGYAPNYTPMAATDGHRGFIVDADVIRDTAEHEVTVAAVDRIAENFGEQPEKLLADGAHATGHNVDALERRGVELFSPAGSPEPEPGHPAWREDPTAPVAVERWGELPRSPHTKKLDRSAFLYERASDTYYCPLGRSLSYEETKTQRRGGGVVHTRVYRCVSCAGCPLAGECLNPTTKHGRTVSRDEYEPQRESLAARMAQPEAKTIYGRRMHIAETPFAIIKAIMGVRRFLSRGLAAVRTEWVWVCTAFNLAKLVRQLTRMRATLWASIDALGV